jgi:hypothetical protein
MAHHWFQFARLDFTGLVAELVNLPGADEHFDLRCYLFVCRVRCGSALLLKAARFALKLHY